MRPDTATETYDVIIVGAGPVGMTAAALLAARGHSVLVLERNSGTSDEPKAISIDDEALRTFAQAGLADDLLGLIVPGTGTRYYGANGEKLFDAGTETPYRLGYPFKNPFAQPDLERLLCATLQHDDRVTLRFGSALIDFRETEHGVVVDYLELGVPRSARSDFVIGADGGRSAVRSKLGVPLAGRSYDDLWLVVDTLRDPHTEQYGMHHGDPERPRVIVPGQSGRCRYEFRLFDGEGSPAVPPSFELISRLLAPHRSIEPAEVERAVIYRFNALIAERWRVGRVFLMGDAAHMMPPFAGQGLNSGIRDAANLCWKISGVLNGELDDSVLESYQQERYDHARATIALSERLGRVVMTTSARLATFRDSVVRRQLATDDGLDYFEHMKYRPASRFTQGLLHTAEPGSAIIGTQIGQPRVLDGRNSRSTLLDDAVGDGWGLFGVGDVVIEPRVLRFAEAAAIPVFAVPLRTDRRPSVHGVRLDDVDGGLRGEFSPYIGRIVLVRPDHVVAAAWRPSDRLALDSVAAWFSAPHPTSEQKEVEECTIQNA